MRQDAKEQEFLLYPLAVEIFSYVLPDIFLFLILIIIRFRRIKGVRKCNQI